MKFNNNTLIVITGTSRGLGKALFDILENKSNKSLLCISRTFNIEQIEKSKSKKYINLLKVDLSNSDELDNKLDLFFMDFLKNYNKVIFVNNAASIGEITKIGKLCNKDIQKLISTNITSPIIITNKLLKFATNYDLKIINIGTGAAINPIAGLSIYCTSKCGIKMFFDVLREQEKDNLSIEVINFDPGVFDTDMQKKIRESDSENLPTVQKFKSFYEEGQVQSPNEVAKKILSLF